MVVQDLSARPGQHPCQEPAPCHFAQKQAARETRADWLRTYSLRRRGVKANGGGNRPESKDLAGEGANSEWRMANGEWRIGHAIPTRYSVLASLKPKGFPGRCPRVPRRQGLTSLKMP